MGRETNENKYIPINMTFAIVHVRHDFFTALSATYTFTYTLKLRVMLKKYCFIYCGSLFSPKRMLPRNDTSYNSSNQKRPFKLWDIRENVAKIGLCLHKLFMYSSAAPHCILSTKSFSTESMYKFYFQYHIHSSLCGYPQHVLITRKLPYYIPHILPKDLT